jgi:hypothetical protein
MMVALRSFESSVLIKVTRRNIAEDGILDSHRRKNLKSYEIITKCTKFKIYSYFVLL